MNKTRILLVLVLALVALALALLINTAHAASGAAVWVQYEPSPRIWSISNVSVEPSPHGTDATYLTFTLTNHTAECLRIANDTMVLYLIQPDRTVIHATVLPTSQAPGDLVWQVITPDPTVGVMLVGYDTAVSIDWSDQ